MTRHETRFAFPAKLTRDHQNSDFTISFRDLPEALTAGDDRVEALEQAVDCLDEAIAGRNDDDDEIPIPWVAKCGEALISLGADEKEVPRLLDPGHPSKIIRLAEGLEALNWRMTITFEKTAA